VTSLLVPSAFNGPPTSGNGGWSAGALTALLGGSSLGRTVEVTLRLPPPLETELAVVEQHGTWRALDDQERVVLEAREVEDDLEPSAPVAVEDARTGEAAYAGHRAHPFPTCFSCGPQRGEGDGMRIFPGPVPGRPGVAAATWTPHTSTYEVAWAALDCAGAWASSIEESPRVLGRMTARVDRLPEVGALHVVTGETRGSEGRKHHATTTLRDASGVLLGVARQVWIDVAG
jgi:hypothetical protein